MPFAGIIEELDGYRDDCTERNTDYSLVKFTIFVFHFFLHGWTVNNARCSASIRHDKTLQMNIDNSSCLFLTVIYNRTWHYLQMITKRALRASEPYPDYIISRAACAHIL